MTLSARSTAVLRRYVSVSLLVTATLTIASCAQNPQLLDTTSTTDSLNAEPTASDAYPTGESSESESSTSSESSTTKSASPENLAEDPYLAPNAFIPQPGEDTSSAPTRVVPEGHVSDQSTVPNLTGSSTPSTGTDGSATPDDSSENTGTGEPKPPTGEENPDSGEPKPPAGSTEGASEGAGVQDGPARPASAPPNKSDGTGTTTGEGQPSAPTVPETAAGSTEPAAPTSPQTAKPTTQEPTTAQNSEPAKRLPWSLPNLSVSGVR